MTAYEQFRIFRNETMDRERNARATRSVMAIVGFAAIAVAAVLALGQ